MSVAPNTSRNLDNLFDEKPVQPFKASQYIDLVSRAPTSYLYSRVSDLRQGAENKSGILRQTRSDGVNELLNKFDGMPQVWMNDTGLSAHHGDNISKGMMGLFVKACEHGEIAKGSILILEYIDRLTRLELTEALHLVNTILRAGVIIHVWGNNDFYERDNEFCAIKLVMELKGASAYTKKLSQRITDSAAGNINKCLEGKKDEDGHRYAVRGYGKNAWWVDTSTGYVKPHPKFWDIAREAIDLSLKGWGWIKISEHFTAQNYLIPGADSKNPEVAEKNRIKGWNRPSLLKDLVSKNAILGEKTFSSFNITIPDYYPPLATVKEFSRMRSIRENKKVGGAKKNAALFSGKGRTRCGFCNNTINTIPHNGGKENETRVYRCSNRKCVSGTVDSTYFETAIIKSVGVFITQPVKEENLELELKLGDEIQSVKKTIFACQKSLELAEDVATIQAVTSKLDQNNKKLRELEKAYSALKDVPTPDPLLVDNIPPDVVDYTNTETRTKYRDMFFSHIKELRIKINKNTQKRRNKNVVSFAIEFFNGNVFKTNLFGNKFLQMPDEQWKQIHAFSDETQAKVSKPRPNDGRSEVHQLAEGDTDNNGVIHLYDGANKWFGKCRRGKEVKLIDMDFDPVIGAKDKCEYATIWALLAMRLENGEELFAE